MLARCRVVGIQHSKVTDSLVFEDARLGGGISVHGAVPVEMIGSQVQEHADVGTEGIDEFELEAAEFHYRPGAFRGGVGAGNQRRADVSGEQGGNSRTAQNVFDERGCGGLAVGAGDAEHLSLEETESELDFAPDVDALLTRGAEDGSAGGNTGAGNDQVLIGKNLFGMAAEFQLQACGTQAGERVAEFGSGARVGGGHGRSARGAEERSGYSGARKTDDQHSFAPQFE